MLSKRYAIVNKERCVACGACTKVCPKEAIEIYKGCYAAVNHDICIGCGKCVKTCPAGCIEVRNRGEES